MKKTFTRVMAAALVGAMLLTGCGASDDAASETTDNNSSVTTDESSDSSSADDSAADDDSSSDDTSAASSGSGVDQAIVDKYVLSYNDGYYNMMVPDFSVMTGESTSLDYLLLYEQEVDDNPWTDLVLFSQGDYWKDEKSVDTVRTRLSNADVINGIMSIRETAYKVNAVSSVTYNAASSNTYTNGYGYNYIIEPGTATLTYDTENMDWDFHVNAGNEATSLDMNYVMVIIENGKDYDGDFGFVILDLSDAQDKLSDITAVATTMAESYGGE